MLINRNLKEFTFLALVTMVVLCISGCDNGGNGEIAIFQDNNELTYKTGMYDFGKLYVGESSAEVEFRIQNDGDGTLSLTGSKKVEIIGNDSSSFIIDDVKTSSKIASGVSTTFTIKFVPTNASIKTATISIANTDDNENPFTFTIKGDAQPEYQWTKSIVECYFSTIIAMETDSMNNLYILGYFQYTKEFGSGFGISDVRISKGDQDIFVTKINHNGTYAWTKQLGGLEKDEPCSIAIDSQNNVYVLGQFRDEVNFAEDFGFIDVKKSAGNADIFVTKITSDGNYVWTYAFGNDKYDRCSDIKFDSNDNMYLLCMFSGEINCGEPFGVLDKKQIEETSFATILTKIKSNGDYGWSKQFNRIGGAFLSFDSENNVYIAGRVNKDVDFGEDFGIVDVIEVNLNNISSSIFITKISSEADYVFTEHIDAYDSNRFYLYSFKLDVSGNIYIAGTFHGFIDFGKNFGVTDIKETGEIDENSYFPVKNHDLFIMKINSDLSYGWTKRLISDVPESTCLIDIDNEGDIYISGIFEKEIDFGKDFGTSDVKTTYGGYYYIRNVFLMKITSECRYCWTKQIGEYKKEVLFDSFTIDSVNNIYIGGRFGETIDFGLDFGVADPKTPTTSKDDCFISKLKG